MRPVFGLLFAVVAICSNAQAQVFKCEEGGKVTYQGTPCPKDGKVILIESSSTLTESSSTADEDFGASQILSPERGTYGLYQYRGGVTIAHISCFYARSVNIAIAQRRKKGMPLAELSPAKGDYEACIVAYLPNLRKAYEAADATVWKPAAKAALKEHYIQAIAVLHGIEPNPGEDESEYRRRRDASDAKLREMWTRFELEQ